MAAAPAANRPVSFLYDVAPLLSRAGCNQGTCHGNAAGRGGLRLSLRGEDPAFDFRSLTHESAGRRLDRIHPARSLLLTKPLGILPHGGGPRFVLASREFRILARWMEEGSRFDEPGARRLTRLVVSPGQRVLVEPAHEQPLRVEAEFTDGSRRDVTFEAVYESSEIRAAVSPAGRVSAPAGVETAVLVRFAGAMATARIAFVPRRRGFIWSRPPAFNGIDSLVYDRLKTLRIQPSGLCSDETFIRRAFLDAAGILPTPQEVRAFLAESRSGRREARERLIDRLLTRPEFDDFWTLKWSDLLRVEERSLDPQGVAAFQNWLRESVAGRVPLDRFVRELLTARGSTYEHPEANYYRRTREPDEQAEVTAQLFMGVRLRCARCHNHPFDRWTQADYYSMAANFAGVQFKMIDVTRRDKFDEHELIGEIVVATGGEGKVKHPRTGETMAARMPGERQPLPATAEDARERLAEWLTAPGNPFFARAMANRIWFHLLGRGIVEPVDDFRASNPPANDGLLDYLARQLRDGGYDLRTLVRLIMRSRTYQLSPVPNATNLEDERYFSRAVVRRLSAEQLMDAISSATGVPEKFPGFPVGMRAAELPPVRQPNSFLKLFGRPARETPCECERSGETTLGQSFNLIAGSAIDNRLREPANRIGALMEAKATDEALVDELYLAALSRHPRAAEMRTARTYLARRPAAREAREDLLWALLNSKEFLVRQ